MAKLKLEGKVSVIEILQDPDDEEMVLARCIVHHGPNSWSTAPACGWTGRWDGLQDTIEYSYNHAETGGE